LHCGTGRGKRWLVIAACALLVAGMARGGPRVCGRCGYENEEFNSECSHCSGPLPEVQGDRSDDGDGERGESSEQGADNPSMMALVDGEIEAALEYARRSDMEVARLFLKNALAMNGLTEVAEGRVRGARILEHLKQCDRVEGGRLETCPVCGGSGKRMVKIQSLASTDERSSAFRAEGEYRAVAGSVCPDCSGAGQVRRARTMDERKFRLGRAKARYVEAQQARRMTMEGNAWVPPAVAEVLSAADSAALRKTVASPCPACAGLGRVDCEECRASGGVPCPGRGCDDGTVEVKVGGGLTGKALVRRQKCATCQGRASVACSVCKGEGSVVCSKCGGSGARPECKKCGGGGVVACKRCDGSGERNGEACGACGRAGFAICSSCGGDGRKR